MFAVHTALKISDKKDLKISDKKDLKISDKKDLAATGMPAWWRMVESVERKGKESEKGRVEK